MRNSLVIAAGMLLSVASLASEYTSAKPLLLQAIDAPDGRSKGILVGTVAEKFVSTTGSSAPVRVEVTTVKRFKQEGCRRLNLRMSQADVPTKDGRKVVFAMDYGINLCRDGSPAGEE
ncbi:MAG: hypothetical protein Q8M09_11885 [Pseudomonadota bacterium]|nr:hypothetical protein [Pseudomonadota bacterium]MDP1904930.1 hypothetical protein [Pseudomonadota bacterium]MDP2352053.1 hypothetical protein [Pseudomonadota bacterium]